MLVTASLYGDSTPATREAVEVLSSHGIPFQLILSHNAPTTPTLGTPIGDIFGVANIRCFAEKIGQRDSNRGLHSLHRAP